MRLDEKPSTPWPLAILGLGLMLAMVACGPPPPTPGKAGAGSSKRFFGTAAPLTGDNAQFGTMIKRGAELAIQEINAKGGVRGEKISLSSEDDVANPKEAAQVAQKLASNPNVYAVIGHFNSSCSLAGKPIYAENKVLQITSASTNTKICKGSDWTFRNIYDDAFQGETLARYAREVLGLERVAVFFDNDDYGIGLKNSFLAKAGEIGLKVVFIQAYNRDTTDYRPHLSKFTELKPEAIMVAGLFTQCAKIARQAREIGVQVPLLAGDGVLSDDYVKLAEKAADNTYISSPFLFDLGGARAEAFRKAFQAAYGTSPDAWAALAYDAAQILAQATEKVGWDRQKIRDEVAKMTSADKAFDGITGRTFFDAQGDCKKPIHMALVQEGKILAAPKQLGGK